MGNLTILRASVVAMLIAGSYCARLAGQSTCTYDDCALRIRYRPFAGADVVKGRNNEKVAGYSFFGFAPNVPMLADGPDSVRINHDSFRSRNNSGVVLQLVGTGLLLAGYVAVTIDNDNG